MIGHHYASSAITLLVLLTGASSILHQSDASPIHNPGDNLQSAAPTGLAVSGNREKRDEERQSIQKRVAMEEEHEDELFKDVDPKTLAAVLLEALNHSQVERSRDGEYGMEKEMKPEMEEVKKEEAYREMRTMEGADRDRDGRRELELLMNAQGKERERQEADERKKAQEEEEKMTERVTSHTTSQTVQIQTQQQPTIPDGRGADGLGGVPQQGPTSLEQGNEEEEQLSPEELKSLETMMKEFPRLYIANRREGDSKQTQRVSRGYSSYNDIIPINKGSNLAMSKKKMKWQEETQKALNFPTFRGGNFMEEFEDSNYAGGNAAQSQPLSQQEVMEDDEPEEEEEEEEDEEVLSPEEEEARAKAEQEEMRRQAAEAQRAKMEEEKLADIASDMLLRYMVKQNNGNKKYSSTLSNAAEDKRSDEEQGVTEEDDIDPQTIDKLIEISSKLHLPADDVVDIISDVEKKKKKDVLPEMTSRWQRPLMPLSASSSTNDFSVLRTNQISSPVSKQPSPAVNVLKTWFQSKSPTKSQDLWSKSVKPTNQNLWPKSQKALSVKQDPWLKSPKSVWTGYPPFPSTYPSYYQRKHYSDYYPIYVPTPPRPKLRYYVPRPALTLNNLLGNSVDDVYSFPPKRRYHSWVQPRLRKPPSGFHQKPYYTSYPLPLYLQTFQPLPIPRPHSPPRMSVIPPQQKQFYYSAPAPTATRNQDYYVAGKQADSSKHDDLEKYIQQILKKKPEMLD